STGNIESGSITGLVRWSHNSWFAVAARPEALRWTSVVSCGPTGCLTPSSYHTRLSIGAEIGRLPGAVLTGLGAAGTYLMYLAIASVD
ncbi:MAG TPA: hypothetical protein VKB45_17090, partial [Gemmatimonadales bacterium]|nr:hypothetical protein [Gemmatimonadales bacterium]